MTDELNSICPVCDKDIKIDAGSIKRAVMHRNATEGKALVGCPECCHVLTLPDIPATGDVNLDEYISKYDTREEDDWLACLPLLDAMDAKMPNGFVEHLGVKWWTPGDETQAIPPLQYMLKYGISPECAWIAMRKKS
jgi:hypothetical protein